MKEIVIKKFEELLLDHKHQLEDLLISNDYYNDICIAHLIGKRLIHSFSKEKIESLRQYQDLSCKKLMLDLAGKSDKFYNDYSFPHYNKSKTLQSYIEQYERMINKINKLEIIPCPEEFEKYLNPYGLFIDRKHVYFEDKFNDLDDEAKVLVFIQELIQSYAKTKHDCEGLLGLYHLKLINNKIPYAQIKRSKLVEIYEEKYGVFPYIFKPSRQKVRYLKDLVKEKTLLEDPCDKNIYYRDCKIYMNQYIEEHFVLITQYAGV